MTNKTILRVSFGFAIACVAGWWLAQRPERTRAPGIEEDRESHNVVAELKRENAEPGGQAAVLEHAQRQPLAERGGQPHTEVVVIPLGHAPLPDYLRGIELPKRPTKRQAQDYVARILRATARHGNGFGANDPEVNLLTMVGPEHVDVLLEPLLHRTNLDGDIYLLEALKSLVQDDHKDLILGSLPRAPELVGVVQRRGWTNEAAPILLRILGNRPGGRWYLPQSLIKAVAELRRPESYADLRDYFHHGQNHYDTWKAIRDLPGLDLEPVVERLWLSARELDATTRVDVAAVAACYGYSDALGVLFEDPQRWWKAREVIESVTSFSGPYERAKEWFDEHKDRLSFQHGKYVVTE